MSECAGIGKKGVGLEADLVHPNSRVKPRLGESVGVRIEGELL